MKEFQFKKIDAFATNDSEGNPAGYIWLVHHLQFRQMTCSKLPVN